MNQYLIALVDEEFDQFSQELRFISDPDRRIRWLAGGYFDTGSLGSSVHALLAGMGGFDVRTDQDNDSWSVFGELDFDLGDEVFLRLGGRYTEVDKDVNNSDVFVVGIPNATVPLPPASGMTFFVTDTRTDSKFTPAVTFEWRPADTCMLCASWKEGFKAGSFNHLQGGGAAISYEPEEAVTFKVGAKFTMENVYLNIAAFVSDYDELQVASRIGVSSQDGSWELAFVGRNLTDELVPLFVGDGADLPRGLGVGGQPTARSLPLARGRETAVSFRYNFWREPGRTGGQ